MKTQSFEELCARKGWDQATILPDVSMLPEKHQSAIIATCMMFLIAEDLNSDDATGEPWSPDWNDYDQRKWVPWFDLEKDEEDNPSGFRFYGTRYGVTNAGSSGGSRLCYRTAELAKYAAEQFLDLYKAMMVLPG